MLEVFTQFNGNSPSSPINCLAREGLSSNKDAQLHPWPGCKAIEKFLKEAAEEISDDRFAIPTDLTNVKLLDSLYCIAKIVDHDYSNLCSSLFLRSFTLAPLTPKGPSIGVLPLAGNTSYFRFEQLPTLFTLQPYLRLRFTVRSFFVGRVEQSDVDAVLERLGGPKLKVGNVYQCMRIYIFIAMFVQIWTILSTNFPCMQVNPSRDQWRFLGDGMVDWVSRRGLGLGLGTVLSPKVEFPNLPNPLAFQCFWTWSKKSHNLRWRKACAIAGWESKEGWAQRGPFLSSGPVTTK